MLIGGWSLIKLRAKHSINFIRQFIFAFNCFALVMYALRCMGFLWHEWRLQKTVSYLEIEEK
ncbi:TPA: hypothetical protein JD344_20425, partial [Serratia marcescens]|nr:hypothetical protein DMW53_13600 [Serratia marcescens]PYB18056.1 hypothetical protein DMW55_12315 [Serratia marcescens]HAU5645357.1 hypothetical protein [Serratia marcescens]HAU5720941.1 hypothetical protein [Serratia marcescens]HAU5740261.1 hypothetical protein [Serratia marcescens]